MKMLRLPFWFFLANLVTLFSGIATNEPIENCLTKILDKYFKNDTILMVVDFESKRNGSDFGIIKKSEPSFGSETLKALMKTSKWTFQVSYNSAYLNWPPELKVKRSKKSFIFLREHQVDSDDDLQEKMEKLKENPLWDPIGKNLIVLKLENSKNDLKNLTKKIIEKFFKVTKSSDVSVMVVPENESIIYFYTWFPYQNENCQDVEKVTLLDTFERFQFKENKNLFPAKVGNDLNGCEVIAAAAQCIPYVFSFADSGYLEKGVEIQLINTLAEKFNFRLTMIEVPDFDVNSSTGMFQFLTDGKVDLAFSCLHLNWERCLRAQALYPYMYDSLVWFVPSPVLMTYASDLFSAFSYNTWFAVIAAATASSLVIVYMTDAGKPENRNSVESFLKVFAMSLSAPVHFATDHFIFRIFVFIFYIYSFHISMFYQGSLYDHFREPHFTGVYRSVDQAIDEGLYVYLYRSTKHFYNQTSFRIWNKILRPGRYSYIEHFDEPLKQIAYKKNAIALYMHIVGASMATIAYKDNNDLPRISWLDQKYSPYPVTMYLAPGSPLFPLFQKQIYRLTASGLVNFWVSQTIDSRGSVKLRDLRHFSAYGKGPLTWKHLNVSFYLFSGLQVFAVFVLLWEITTFSYDFNPHRRHLNQKLRAWVEKSRIFL